MNATQVVYSAYLDGSRTVDEVNALTGVPKPMISKVTFKLVKRGLIVRTGNDSRAGIGNTSGFYEPRTT